MSRKLLAFLGARSEWGYVQPVLQGALDRDWEVELCLSNLILLPQNDSLLHELEQGEYNPKYRLLSSVAGDSLASMAKSIGLVIQGFVDVLLSSDPDWVLLSGDRVEQLGAAVASSTMYIPTAHIQGGERSGNIDGINRHAITKLAHIHFASNDDARDRLLNLGEEDWRVILTGAPQLDSLLKAKISTRDELTAKGLVRDKNFVLAVFHGVTEDQNDFEHLQNAMAELANIENQVVWILPNNDVRGELFRNYILEQKRPADFAFSNLPRDDYVSLMKYANFMIGNSSSGLLEAPSLSLPAVNVGVRQADRVAGENVIHSDGSRSSIAEAIQLARSLPFRNSIEGCLNPYGDGKAVPRILEALETLDGKSSLTIKKITY